MGAPSRACAGRTCSNSPVRGGGTCGRGRLGRGGGSDGLGRYPPSELLGRRAAQAVLACTTMVSACFAAAARRSSWSTVTVSGQRPTWASRGLPEKRALPGRKGARRSKSWVRSARWSSPAPPLVCSCQIGMPGTASAHRSWTASSSVTDSGTARARRQLTSRAPSCTSTVRRGAEDTGVNQVGSERAKAAQALMQVSQLAAKQDGREQPGTGANAESRPHTSLGSEPIASAVA